MLNFCFLSMISSSRLLSFSMYPMTFCSALPLMQFFCASSAATRIFSLFSSNSPFWR